jgi:hypothetical protein
MKALEDRISRKKKEAEAEALAAKSSKKKANERVFPHRDWGLADFTGKCMF